MTSAARSTRWARFFRASTAVTTSLAGLTLAFAASAQDYRGNDVTSGPFSSGAQFFYDTSTLNASTANAVSGGGQWFYSSSALNASATDAVSGGSQGFYNTSSLNASAASAVSGGAQRFYITSVLNASAADAVSGGDQTFNDTSTLNASAADAVSGGDQYFWGTSATLNALAADAVSGGNQQFYSTSALNASAAGAVSGGSQHFDNTSALNASATNAVSGGNQQFYGTSALNASAANALGGGIQFFVDTSALNASVTNAVSGGDQTFNDTSTLNASAADAVSGGRQWFYNTSALNASAADALSGGLQYFNDTSALNASATNAVNGGTQQFYNTSALNASAADAVSGGTQQFADTSALNASAAGAVSGGFQYFNDTSALNASATNAVSGGTQQFYGTSALNASAANTLGGGTQYFLNTSALNASVTNAVNGGLINLYNDASVQVQAANALTSGASLTFHSGGNLVLNGFSTTVGQISGAGGVIRNTGATDATLTVDSSVHGDASLGGTIEDGGLGALGLTKAGAGTLTLTGTNSYTGETRVNGGRLIVNGDNRSSAHTVGSGAVLGGSGTVGTTVIDYGGRVSPGNSIGTLHVAGDFTFNAGSIYEVEVDPAGASSDLIAVSGTAFLNGSVLHIGMPGAYRPTSTYTILTAGTGISGTFDGEASSNFAFLDATLAYSVNDVTLTLARNDTDFAAIGATRNQRATGAGVESLGSGHTIYDTIVGQDADTARAAFDSLSGEIHGSVKTALIEDSRFVRDAASGRVRAAFDGVGASSGATTTYGRAITGWGQIFGSWGHSDSDGNAARMDRQTQGVLAGADAIVGENWRIGALTGFSHTSLHTERASSGSSDTTHLGLYGGTQWNVLGGALGLRTVAAYSWHDIETERFVSFPGFATETVKADYDGGSAQVFGELGYRIDGAVAFEPFANLSHVNLHTDHFGEAGGDAALAVRKGSTDVMFSTLGLRAASTFLLGDGITATARGALGWRHAFGDTTPLSTHSLAGGDAFVVAGAPIAQDAVLVEAGLDLRNAYDATFSLSYSGQIAGDAHDHGFTLGLSVPF